MTEIKRKKKLYTRAIAAGIIICAILAAAAGAALLMLRYPMRHMQIIEKYSLRYELDPALVFAVINAESRFIDNAVSGAGASGLMQIMEDTAYWIAPMAGLDDFSYQQIFQPDINIRLGCFYLRMCLDRFGNLNTALCAYNAGSGRVDQWLRDESYSSDGVTLNYIPFEETRNYVERVNRYILIYDFLLRFNR